MIPYDASILAEAVEKVTEILKGQGIELSGEAQLQISHVVMDAIQQNGELVLTRTCNRIIREAQNLSQTKSI